MTNPPSTPADSRVERVRHEPKSRDVEVVRVDQLGPHFIAVTFAGEQLKDFASRGFDDHVKFMFFDDRGEKIRRDYTPRRFDNTRGELTIEFALHGEGRTADWARRATTGQRAVVGGPRGSMVVPTDFEWHLLAGDASALPAIHRRLEELPASTRVLVLLQMPDAADRRVLASLAAMELQWVDTDSEWLAALRALDLPAGRGYVWCAGESSVMATARAIVLDEKRHPKADARIAAYWKRGEADFHED
jgi:NADPH-dependent ferric siderophore reductase